MSRHRIALASLVIFPSTIIPLDWDASQEWTPKMLDRPQRGSSTNLYKIIHQVDYLVFSHPFFSTSPKTRKGQSHVDWSALD